MNKGSIGVFDSGLGGLWVLKHLKEKLPDYNYIFLGDQANVPFGGKTPDELFDIATKVLDYLYGEKNCMGVVLACNTISSTIYDRLRDWKDEKYFGRILFGIVRPTVESIDKGKPVVIFATPRTCLSEVYEKFLKENVRNYIKIPLPQLAYLIENGKDTLTYIKYFKDMIGGDIESAALLCTHYGIVREDFKKVFPGVKSWVYQEDLIPKYLAEYFIEFPEREAFFEHGGDLSILVTKESEVFDKFKEEWFPDVDTQIISL
ncbi:aspartate/glutamate racemase family protein [Candidatus Nomurabacteria bacterium]|nr:aspartate/glutamate racemase family protein [Candidatus Nomurabacteria bacterium]